MRAAPGNGEGLAASTAIPARGSRGSQLRRSPCWRVTKVQADFRLQKQRIRCRTSSAASWQA